MSRLLLKELSFIKNLKKQHFFAKKIHFFYNSANHNNLKTHDKFAMYYCQFF